jgi:hypothetical protein
MRQEVNMIRRSTSLAVCGVIATLLSVGFTASGSSPQNLRGAWNVTIELDGSVLCTAPSLITADGGVVANACAPSESPGYGEWVRTGNREFAVTFVGHEYAPDGSQIGTYKVRARGSLGEDSQTFSGPFTSDIFDLNGKLIVSFNGTVRGRRIVVESF